MGLKIPTTKFIYLSDQDSDVTRETTYYADYIDVRRYNILRVINRCQSIKKVLKYY